MAFLHQPAGSQSRRGLAARPIRVMPVRHYTRLISVDLGSDGVAPVATFNGAGVAQAQVGPTGLGNTWSLDQCFLSTSIGQLDAAQCIVFIGPLPTPELAITGSLQGGSSQFGLGGTAVQVGEFVIAQWTGGTAGAFAFLRVTGTKTVQEQW